jgi:hypothetical protein
MVSQSQKDEKKCPKGEGCFSFFSFSRKREKNSRKKKRIPTGMLELTLKIRGNIYRTDEKKEKKNRAYIQVAVRRVALWEKRKKKKKKQKNKKQKKKNGCTTQTQRPPPPPRANFFFKKTPQGRYL